jgi:hypothetical protein
MNLVISDYHQTFEREKKVTRKYVDWLVYSDQNKAFLLEVLFDTFHTSLNKESPAASKLMEHLDHALSIYGSYLDEARHKKDVLEVLSFINAKVIIDVLRMINDDPIKEVYDPLWVLKGPGFQVKTINLDWKQGARAPVVWRGGEFEMEPRFKNSLQPQGRPGLSKNFYHLGETPPSMPPAVHSYYQSKMGLVTAKSNNGVHHMGKPFHRGTNGRAGDRKGVNY